LENTCDVAQLLRNARRKRGQKSEHLLNTSKGTIIYVLASWFAFKNI